MFCTPRADTTYELTDWLPCARDCTVRQLGVASQFGLYMYDSQPVVSMLARWGDITSAKVRFCLAMCVCVCLRHKKNVCTCIVNLRIAGLVSLVSLFV